MAEMQVLGFGNGNAPRERNTKAQEDFTLLAIQASFDGSAAVGSFVPTVQIISDAGELVGTFPMAGTVAAGDSADVTFAPFLRDDVGLTGIYYDVVNTGRWLDIQATTDLSPDSGGISLVAPKGIYLVSTDPAEGQVQIDANFLLVDLHGNVFRVVDASLIELNTDQFTALTTAGWDLEATSGQGTLVVSGASEESSLTLSGSESFVFARSGATYPQGYVDVNPSVSSVFISADDSFSKFCRMTFDSSVPNLLIHVTDGATAGDVVATINHDIDLTAGNDIQLTAGKDVLVFLKAGGTVEVRDHSNLPIFRINEDGSLQGKTGKALTFNL